MRQYISERTALANGKEGARFYMHGDADALAKHDATHMFEVGVEGERLRGALDGFIEMLNEESADTDEYADTYSPGTSEIRRIGARAGGAFPKWASVCLCALVGCLCLSAIAHTLFQIELFSRMLA